MFLNRAIVVLENLISQNHRLASLYMGIHAQVGRKEIQLAGIKPGDRVLHIGCGAVPYTAILFAQAGAMVTAIDNNPKAVALASRLVAQAKETERVKVECGDGLTFPLNLFDVVVVSLGAEPKREVIERTLQVMGQGARIIYRNPNGIFARSYTGKTIYFGDEVATTNVPHGSITFRASVVAIKKGAPPV